MSIGTRDDRIEPAAARHRQPEHGDEADDSRGVAGGEAAGVVADFERVEAVRAGADERRVVVVPRLGPVAAAQVAERFAELVGHDQADAGDEQRVLPVLATVRTPANASSTSTSGDQLCTSGGGSVSQRNSSNFAISWSWTKNATGRSTK